MSDHVTVLTPSIVGRSALLADLVESMGRLTEQPAAHLIRVHEPPDQLSGRDTAQQMDILMRCVDTPWIMPFADDDLFLPNHFEIVHPVLASTDADVVYTHGENITQPNTNDWDQADILREMERDNFIPGSACIRSEIIREAGGFLGLTEGERFASGAKWEDHDLWLRILRAGGRFLCVPVVTWIYQPGNWPRNLDAADTSDQEHRPQNVALHSMISGERAMSSAAARLVVEQHGTLLRSSEEIAAVNTELQGVNRELAGVNKELAGVNQGLAGVRQELADLGHQHAETQNLLNEATTSRDEALADLERLRSTKLFRYAEPARRLYGRLRRSR